MFQHLWILLTRDMTVPFSTNLFPKGCWALKTLHIKILLGKTGLLDKELPITKLLTISALSKWTSRTQETLAHGLVCIDDHLKADRRTFLLSCSHVFSWHGCRASGREMRVHALYPWVEWLDEDSCICGSIWFVLYLELSLFIASLNNLVIRLLWVLLQTEVSQIFAVEWYLMVRHNSDLKKTRKYGH